jgi:hypothetical protein
VYALVKSPFVRDLELLLDKGLHVFNSGTVSFEGTKVYANNEYFHHGRYIYLRVPRGKFAKVWAEVKDRDGNKSVVARLLTQGEHFVGNFLFRCEGFVGCSQEYIGHGSVHRISVTKGHVAKIVQDNKPRLLGEGTHLIESTDFSYDGIVCIVSNLVIVHKTITILRVTLGTVALAWQDSEPVFITKQGLFEYDSPDFEFVEFKDASDRLIHLGAKKIVLLQTGEVGVTYDNGDLADSCQWKALDQQLDAHLPSLLVDSAKVYSSCDFECRRESLSFCSSQGKKESYG